MPTLREIIDAQTATTKELPLVHTTRCETLKYITASNELNSRAECKVFSERLLYFFYGRPAFKHKSADEPAPVLDPCPVCFVFKRQPLSKPPKRIFACDTGAMYWGIFEDVLFPADIPGMALSPSLTSAQRLVSWMFGGNENYLLGAAKAPAPPEVINGTVAARYYRLLTSPQALKKKPDDRRSAIEVQTDTPVALTNSLDYVILPNQKLGEPGLREKIQNEWDATPLGYDFVKFRPPAEYRTIFYEKLKPFFEKEDLL